MTREHRHARWIAGTLAVAVLTLAARWIDVPSLAGGVKGDEATYVAMALSLAHDGDLKYEARDLARFREVYRQGPEGIFLKRSSHLSVRVQAAWPPLRVIRTSVPTTRSLSFAKAFAYPLFAAPFAALGGLGGLLLFNALLLALATWCAVRFCQARVGRWLGALLGVSFVFASVVPVYGAFLTSETFNFAMVLVAYFLWLFKRVAHGEGPLFSPRTDIAAAVLIGIATYSKPGILIAPLLMAGVFEWSRRHLLAVAAAFFLTAAGFFALTTLVTGEWNFQGGDRKSFYGDFPYSGTSLTFDAYGSQMSTNDIDAGMVFASETMRLLPTNARYFLVGRDAGLVPYYFPGVAIAALWLARLRRSSWWQWTLLLTCVGSILALLIYFPFTWNGAGGPPGNRYFLAVYPTLLFLLPAASAAAFAAIVAAVGTAFTGAMVVRPFAATADTWRNVGRAPLRWLPIELTIMDELPVRLNQSRGRILFVKDPTVFTYAMDANMYFAEGQGFWIRGGASTDIVLRTDRPLTRLDLDISTRVPNVVTVDFAGRSTRVTLPAHGSADVGLTPRDQIDVHESFPYVLHLSATNGFVPAQTDPGATDDRYLGVFVRLAFMYGLRGEPLPPARSGSPGGA